MPYNDNLGDDVDHLAVLFQPCQSLIDVGAGSFDNESAVVAQNVIQIFLGPHARRTHCLDEVSTREEGDAHGSLVSIHVFATPNDLVYFVVEVVQHLRGRHIVRLNSLPWVACEPLGCLLSSDATHLDTVLGPGQAGLLVGVGHRRQKTANDLVLGVEAGKVRCHFEHAEVKEGDRAICNLGVSARHIMHADAGRSPERATSH